MAKEAFNKSRELLIKNFEKTITKRLVKTLVWSVALYAAETWTMLKDDLRRLEALEMWLWRRIEKISWTEKITNNEVLRRVGEKCSMVNLVVNRKKNWIGHVLRREGLMREVIVGRMMGKRTRGRKRNGMLEMENGSYETLKRRSQNRRFWMPRICRMVEN